MAALWVYVGQIEMMGFSHTPRFWFSLFSPAQAPFMDTHTHYLVYSTYAMATLFFYTFLLIYHTMYATTISHYNMPYSLYVVRANVAFVCYVCRWWFVVNNSLDIRPAT